ncbi:MAG TPA: hypothetical protein VMR16_03515, partial [Candidatus Saccharimonadales bacterium]|nr:hypothetical protein [Candidatus Saccharimonadales bacterium]
MNDRSELSKLYPEVKSETDKQTQAAVSVPPIILNKKISFVHIFSIAVLLTMSVVMFVLFSDFLNQSVDVNNIPNIFSEILLILVIWVVSLIFVLLVAIKRLNNTGISKFSFLILYAICA